MLAEVQLTRCFSPALLINSFSQNHPLRSFALLLPSRAVPPPALYTRQAVGDDPEAKDFPWRPKLLSELIGTEFLTKSGGIAGEEVIRGKTLALYFSAHW